MYRKKTTGSKNYTFFIFLRNIIYLIFNLFLQIQNKNVSQVGSGLLIQTSQGVFFQYIRHTEEQILNLVL